MLFLLLLFVFVRIIVIIVLVFVLKTKEILKNNLFFCLFVFFFLPSWKNLFFEVLLL